MNKKAWFKVLAICVIIFLALSAVKIMKIRAAIAFGESFPEPSEHVESFYSLVQPYVQTIEMVGEVVAPKNVALYSEMPGRIIKVGFSSGDSVKKGQLLLQLDSAEEQAQLDSATARLELAQSIYLRNKNLYATNALSEDQYQRSRADLATVKAEIARLKAILRKKIIEAPFSGRTGIHQFEVGSFILDNVLVTHVISAEDYVWVDFSVPQFYTAMAKGIEIEVSRLHQQDSPSQSQWVKGVIIAQSPQVNSQSRSFQYRAQVDAHALDAGINMAVSIRLPLGHQTDMITIPSTAVLRDQLGQYVYVLSPDNSAGGFRAERRNVDIEIIQNQQASITKGLAENELVASDGAFKLMPGLLVFTKPSNKAVINPQQRGN